MVQGIEKVLDKPVYSAVNIRINKPEVNPRENGNMTVTNDNGIYNAVKIDIDRPAVNAEPKKVYDYPESKEVVTYDNANIQPVALPEGFPAGNAYKANAEDVVAEEVPAEEATVPEANYTTVEQEKAEEPSKEGDVAFHGADNAKKKPEIVPSEEIKPEVNISETVALLSGNDYDKQAVEIAKIAYLSETNPEAAKAYIVRDVFNGLIDVVKKDSSKLQGPSEKQNEIRQKIVADIIAAQRKQPIPYQISKEEQELATECKQILASTEDVWSQVFQKMGRTYEPPTLVLFSNQVNSACGSATAAVGPFYCSGDQKLYIDLSFFTQMKRQLGVEGNTFAYAYVIAHEIGHHVEYSLGILGKAHQAMNQTDKVSANQISVRLELLADYYAGVWAHYEDQMNHSMEYGDLEKGLELAKAIGDDWLQKKAQGRATPESFTHGTSDQRKRWLRKGYETGDMNTSTFNIQNYNDL